MSVDATVRVEFYGTTRDAVGEKTLVRTVEPGTTVNAALREVATEYPDLYSLLFTSEERLRPHINVARNETPIRDQSGPETELADGDLLTVAPSVSGGSPAGGATRQVARGGTATVPGFVEGDR
jgi:MoaD family protein